MSDLLVRFRPLLASLSEDEIRRDVSLGGRLTLDESGPLKVTYAPFEHVVNTARVVIVGITPGATQARNALSEARRHILAGADNAAVLAAAKIHASFSGAMRDGLVAMLDHVGLHRKLGIPTTARLWDTHGHLAHFTSALRYPVFYKGDNYRGTPSMTGTPLLRHHLAESLAEEARALPGALWIPCGSTAAKGVGWLVRQGLLAHGQVCDGLLHPSPANVERVQYFLGIGRPRSELSEKTNPDAIDAAKERIVARIAALAAA